MDPEALPPDDAYPVQSPINIYLSGIEFLEREWNRSSRYRSELPGTTRFEEFVFWRRNLVIWGACTIEALVNLEGVCCMGMEFYKRTTERQGIIAKISLVYAMKYGGKRLSGGDSVLRDVKKLFKLRDQLVHPKANPCPIPKSRQDENTTVNLDEYDTHCPSSVRNIVRRLAELLMADPG